MCEQRCANCPICCSLVHTVYCPGYVDTESYALKLQDLYFETNGLLQCFKKENESLEKRINELEEKH